MAPGKQPHLRSGVYMHLVQGVDSAQSGTVAMLDAGLGKPVLTHVDRGKPL